MTFRVCWYVRYLHLSRSRWVSRLQQDAAYQESLRADQEKERRRQEERERQEQEERARQEEERQRQLKKEVRGCRGLEGSGSMGMVVL